MGGSAAGQLSCPPVRVESLRRARCSGVAFAPPLLLRLCGKCDCAGRCHLLQPPRRGLTLSMHVSDHAIFSRRPSFPGLLSTSFVSALSASQSLHLNAEES